MTSADSPFAEEIRDNFIREVENLQAHFRWVLRCILGVKFNKHYSRSVVWMSFKNFNFIMLKHRVHWSLIMYNWIYKLALFNPSFKKLNCAFKLSESAQQSRSPSRDSFLSLKSALATKLILGRCGRCKHHGESPSEIWWYQFNFCLATMYSPKRINLKTL